jgi:hypothetical protein
MLVRVAVLRLFVFFHRIFYDVDFFNSIFKNWKILQSFSVSLSNITQIS